MDPHATPDGTNPAPANSTHRRPTCDNAQLPGIAAPRGALSYSQLSWEALGGMFLGLMPYPAPKGYGNSSMAAKRWTS